MGENGQFSFILRPTGPSAPLNFQFSFFFLRPTGTLELSENLFGTLQSARGKKIWKIVVLP